ncbi:MAG: hypothetical protein IJY89_02130 [Clostridia bacterium]|nr:hypothetical protein [Clostridia bacterium]MBQ8911351.1 hypothetical protein [Clostridia bacterium]
MMRHRIRKLKRNLCILLLLLLALCLWIRHLRSEEDLPPAASPVLSVEDASACTVTLSLTGREGETALRLFTSVCEGTGITPCVFVTTEWLEENGDLLPLLSGTTLGLLYEDSPKRFTQKRTMAYMAEENQRFMSYTGFFPRYVRLAEGQNSKTVSAALQAYGQLSLGSSQTLSDPPAEGAIVECGFLDGTTGYLLAKFYGEALAAECPIVPLETLLNGEEA